MSVEPESSHVQQSRILRALLENDALLESTCRPYADHTLLDYISAELNGQDAAALYPAFHKHLAQLPECWQEYSEMKQLLLLERTAQLVAPPLPGTFDLSFLRKGAAPLKDMTAAPVAPFWRLAADRVIIAFSTEVLQTFQPPAVQPAYATARAEQGAQIRYQFALMQEVEDLRVTVTVRDKVTHPDRCTLIVEADIPSRGGWPNLGDTEVVLKQGDQLREQQQTDAFGKVVFADIPSSDLAHLVIEIAPDRG